MNILKNLSRCAAAALAVCFAAAAMPIQAMAEETADAQLGAESEAKQIFTYEDLLAIKDDPAGNYKLMCDIDLKDKAWTPLDFTGTFDGQGFAIMNAKITDVTEDTRQTYDGNMIDYATVFSGFFGIAENAVIKNLNLLGVDVDVNTENDCFVGGLCGYTYGTEIDNCTVKGKVSLYVYGAMFGVGGAIGFGTGHITNSTIDTTLICVDTDVEDKDEQFMGGVNANGYLSIDSCNVIIDGYDSDHGYVHDGGLSGMYIRFDTDEYIGSITNNTVTGMITFFEDNLDRRAYCEGAIGEDMSESAVFDGNTYDFTRNEVFEYDTDLLPETCENPQYEANTVAPADPSYGYTEYVCAGCGYTYDADYVSPVHTVAAWNVLKEASDSTQGVQQGTCSVCNKTIYQLYDKPVETTTTETTTTAAVTEAESITQTTPANESTQGQSSKVFVIIAVALVVVIVILLVIILCVKEKRRKEMERRKKARRRQSQERRRNR